MSKKCPHYGSYNTEAAIGNNVGRGFVHVGRGILAVEAMTVGSQKGPTAGKVAGYSVWKNTVPAPSIGTSAVIAEKSSDKKIII